MSYEATKHQQQTTEDQEYATVSISANESYGRTSPQIDAAKASVAGDLDKATPRINADITVTQNDAYITSSDVQVEHNQSYGISIVPRVNDPAQNEDAFVISTKDISVESNATALETDVDLTENYAYVTSSEIQVESNQCYGTTTVPQVDTNVTPAQNQANVTSTEDISEQSKQCYVTATDTDVDLTCNDAYVTSSEIQVEYNQCYGTKMPAESFSQSIQPESDDYVIP